MKRILSVVLSLVFAGIIAGCALIHSAGGSSGEELSENPEMGEKVLYYESILPNNPPYLYGQPYVANRLTRESLIAEYNEWKNQYVVSAGNGMLRVRRDAGTSYDTVSEGIGYGMLLAVYFNDQPTFDGLYKYAKAHFHSRGLMHWMVRADGVDISEFGLPVPHDAVWKNTNTGEIVASSTQPSGSGWVRLCTYGRGRTSATDADVDMALALCMAYKLWGSSANYNYETEAKTLISNIMNYDMGVGFNNELFLYNGVWDNNGTGIWGGKNGWNPSYFTPAWYPIFEEMTGDTRWGLLADKMWDEIAKIEAVNNNTGLLPDWCDTSGATPTQPKKVGNVAASDIIVNVLVENGKTNYYTNEPGKMSYNVYYDGIRVLWRMAVAASWFGDENAKRIVEKQHNFFKNIIRSSINNLKDGYSIDGSAWNIANKDALNVAVGGQWTTSPFVSMVATSALISTNAYSYAFQLYYWVWNSKTPYTDNYHYYGNTLRLLSLIYLSGEFPNLFQLTITGNTNFWLIPGVIQAENLVSGENLSIVNDTTAESGKCISLNSSTGWANYNLLPQTNNFYSHVLYFPEDRESFTVKLRVKTFGSDQKIVINDPNYSPILWGAGPYEYEISLPNTGGNWQIVTGPTISYRRGRNTLLFRLSGSQGILSLDSIYFERPQTKISLPQHFEAEDFNFQKDCNVNKVFVWGTSPDSYMEYKVNVTKPGYYEIVSRAQYLGNNHSVDLLLDGNSIGKMIYPTLSQYNGVVLSNIYLSSGYHTLRVNIANAPRSIDFFNFRLMNRVNIPARIQAENYNSMSNTSIGITDGITRISGDRAGTSYWVEYNVSVPVTRSYTLRYRVSSTSYNSHKLSFSTNGIVISTIDVPQSDWTNIQTTVNLVQGDYTIRIYSPNGGRYAFDWFELE